VSKRLGLLLGGTALFWLVVALAASQLWGTRMVAISAAAAGLCLLPTVATLLWGVWAQEQAPAQQLLMIMGGTGVRMFVVLGVGLLLSTLVPYFKEENLYPFWGCILVFYMFTLGLEVTLLIVGRQATEPQTAGAKLPTPNEPVQSQS
jgi:hypothetical protein